MPKLPQGKNFGAGDAIPEVRCNDMQENVQICSDNQSEVPHRQLKLVQLLLTIDHSADS